MEKKINYSDIAKGDREDFKDTVEVEYEEIKYISIKAALFVIDGDEYWLPKSQIVYLDDEIVEVSKWIAENNHI